MSEELENIEFDKHIRERYANHGVPPSEKLWAKIDNNAAQLETSTIKNRLAFYKWITLGLSLLLVGTIIYYQFGTNNKKIALLSKNNNGIEKVSNKTSHSINTVEIKETKNKTSSIASTSNTIDKESIETKNSKNNQFIKIESTNLKITKTTANNKNEKIIESSNKSDQISSNKTIKTTKKNSNKKITPSFKKKIYYSLVDKKMNTITDIPDEKQTNQIENNEIQFSAENKEELTRFTETDKNENTSINNGFEKPNEVIVELPNETMELITPIQSNSININRTEIKSRIISPPPIIPEKTLSRLTLSILFLPTYSSQFLTLSDNSKATELYNTNNTNKIQFNAGLTIGYNISNNLTVKLGANYSKLNNEYALNNVRPNELPIIIDPINKSIQINSALGTVLAENLDEFEFAGEGEDDYELNDEGDFASLSYKEEQKFTFIHFPLTIGYELGKGKIKLIVDLGIVTSYITKSSSKIEIINSNRPQEIIKKENYL